MALFNYATRELSAKIVYYGPGLSGKTTNIEMVHKMLRPEQKGRLISLPTETDRTLFFDFLPIELGQIKGFKVRFHLYTVPGQVFYNATRRLVLQGVDGVVFVADSQREMINGDMESLKNLMDNLSSYGKKLEELPFVLQYNKRDLRNAASVEELDTALNFLRVSTFEAVAPTGKGVTETLVGISRMVFSHLRKTLLMPGEMAAHDDIGDLADARIRKTFATPAAEPLEEISDLEEIREEGEGARAAAPEAPVAEVDLEDRQIPRLDADRDPVIRIRPLHGQQTVVEPCDSEARLVPTLMRRRIVGMRAMGRCGPGGAAQDRCGDERGDREQAGPHGARVVVVDLRHRSFLSSRLIVHLLETPASGVYSKAAVMRPPRAGRLRGGRATRTVRAPARPAPGRGRSSTRLRLRLGRCRLRHRTRQPRGRLRGASPRRAPPGADW